MREFFCGWKRKIGVIALVLACVFVAGWARSGDKYDVLSVPFGDMVFYSENIDGRFLLSVFEYDHASRRGRRFPKSIEWRTNQKRSASFVVRADGAWGKHPFQLATAKEGSGGGILTIRFLSMPYWSIVMPTMLISAWCLLTRPRTNPATKPESSHA